MLLGLTGWTLCYFAIVTKLKAKNKRFGSKRYGRSDLLLWRNNHKTMVTFRLHEEIEILWISGAISESTSVSMSSSTDATISVMSKARGKLLDVNCMTAIESELPQSSAAGRSRASSEVHEGSSDFVLMFENSHCESRGFMINSIIQRLMWIQIALSSWSLLTKLRGLLPQLLLRLPGPPRTTLCAVSAALLLLIHTPVHQCVKIVA